MEPGAVVVAPVDADADAGEDRPIDEFRLIAPREDGRRIIGPEETMLLHADGSEVPVEIVATDALLRISRNPLERRRLHRQVRIITFRDIAARQQAAAAQQAAMDELIAANRSKSEFLAIMSHELHTPLNAIIGFSEVLQGQLFGPLGSEKYEAYVKDILSSGRHLLALIDDILDVSRVEAGQYKLEEGSVSLSSVIDKTVGLLRPSSDARSIQIDMNIAEELPRIIGDTRILKQIITNVISNAIKFSEDGGRVNISVVAVDDGGIELAVSDNGIGIPESELGRVTEAFFQVDSGLARMHEGSGLGLYLVKKFTELHDGVLDIVSELGEGTTLTVRFPAKRVAPMPIAPPTSAAS